MCASIFTYYFLKKQLHIFSLKQSNEDKQWLYKIQKNVEYVDACQWGILMLKVALSLKMLEGIVNLPKNIPKNYLKLSYPVHDNDKVLAGFNRLHVKKYYSYEIKI